MASGVVHERIGGVSESDRSRQERRKLLYPINSTLFRLQTSTGTNCAQGYPAVFLLIDTAYVNRGESAKCTCENSRVDLSEIHVC